MADWVACFGHCLHVRKRATDPVETPAVTNLDVDTSSPEYAWFQRPPRCRPHPSHTHSFLPLLKSSTPCILPPIWNDHVDACLVPSPQSQEGLTHEDRSTLHDKTKGEASTTLDTKPYLPGRTEACASYYPMDIHDNVI